MIFIIDPSVVKILFNFKFEIDRNRSTWIESFDKSKPFWKILSVIEISIQILDRDQNLNEISHDIGEDGYTYEQNNCTNSSLSITSWMIITKSDSWQSCKGKVRYNEHIFESWVILQLEVVNESSLLIFDSFQRAQVILRWELCFGQITEYIPRDSDEVTYCKDNNDQFECFEKIRDHKDQHDIVVIKIWIFSQVWVILNDSLQLLVQKQFDLSHKSVRTQKMEAFLNPNDFDHEE